MGALINSGIGLYEATSRSVKTSFDLLHKGVPIFEQYFDGGNPNVVGVGTLSSRISIPNHNFVSGEEVVYDYEFDFLHQPIGIVTTNIVGIGTTDILPSKLYVIKDDNQYVRFSATAEEATLENPTFIQFRSVGIGTLHRIYSKTTDSRVLLTVDNVIQSPVVGTGVTVSVASSISLITDVLEFSSTINFYNGDLIKVNNEIMRIESVGFSSETSVLVKRPIMGTVLGVHSIGDTIEKISGNYRIESNQVHFASAPYGSIPVGLPENRPDQRDFSGITTSSKFSGRCFIRSAVPGDSRGAYYDNYIFDDISEEFTGFTTDFSLKVNKQNIEDFDLDTSIVLVRGVFQQPKVLTNVTNTGNYKINAGIDSVSLNFIGLTTFYDTDVVSSGVPVGGVVASVGSSQGYGYQKLKQASARAILNNGSIDSILVISGGSGYRPSAQPVVNVYAKSGLIETEEKVLVGQANIGTSIEEKGTIVSIDVTNPGSGYDSLEIIVDAPLNYTNIPLVYSSQSTPGIGTGAKIDVIVGQGSSIIDFNIVDYGYGYKAGEVLTLPVGQNNDGLEDLIDYIYNIIPTSLVVGFSTTYDGPLVIENSAIFDISDSVTVIVGDNQYQSVLQEFNIFVDSVYKDDFSAWSIGELEVFDSPERLFDGKRTTFPLTIDGIQKSIVGDPSVDVQATLLVFINNILQVPGEGYFFDGGSTITFGDPPNGPIPGTTGTGDKCQILFYKGTKDVDVVNVDVLETIKKGDKVQLIGETSNLIQDERMVHLVDSTNSVLTNVYSGVGVVENSRLLRSLKWCKQTEDIFINGEEVTKDRLINEPIVSPISNIIKSVSTATSTTIYTESGKTLFDNYREDITGNRFSSIEIIDQKPIERATASATIQNGSVVSIAVTSNGLGYTQQPIVSIESPVGLGTTARATAVAFINAVGIVTGINVVNPGFGYTQSPQVLIEQPTNNVEKINGVSYVGDFGIITGVAATVVGVATTALIFSLYVPEDSILRDKASTGIAITVSKLQVGDYFTVRNSFVGNGIISVGLDGKVIGVSTSFIDNVYQVYDVNYVKTEFSSVGMTTLTGTEIYNSPALVNNGVTIKIDNDAIIIIDEFSRTDVVTRVSRTYPAITGLPPALNSYGDYSWLKINAPRRSFAKEFISYNTNGVVGIETSPIVRRSKPLNYLNYVS